jgi:hypothetical protein
MKEKRSIFIHRVIQKSVNLKHSLVLTGVFSFETADQFVERCHSVVSCVMNMKDLFLKIFYKFSKK